MKRLKAFFVLFALCSFSYGQVIIQKEEQLLVDEEAEVMLYSLGNQGFFVKQEFESEKSSRDITWRFTKYDLDLSQQWVKDITLEKSCRLSAVNNDHGTIDLVFNVKNSSHFNTQELTIATISPEGVVNMKDFVLKNASTILGYAFVDGNCYFSASKSTSGIVSDNAQDLAYLIDFDKMSITKKEYNFPSSAEINNLFSDGETVYFYASCNQDQVQRDTIFSIVHGELAHKIPVKLGEETAIDNMRLIKIDSNHSFLMGETKKWISGSRKFSDSYDYQYFIAKIDKNSISPIKTIEKKYASEFDLKREVHIRHGRGGNLNNKLMSDNYIIGNSFRIGDKNLVVFDKYQSSKASVKKDREPENYFYKNSIVWCLNDQAEIVWSRNLEYEIISPYRNPVTGSRANANNSITLFGQFEDEFSTITLAHDGLIVGSPEPFKVNSEIDMDDYSIKNSITPLTGNKFVIWGLENETYEQAQKRLKKKDFNRKLNLKIAEIK